MADEHTSQTPGQGGSGPVQAHAGRGWHTAPDSAAADTVDWDRLGQNLAQTGGLLRLVGISLGASVAAGILIDVVKWLRRPPGG